MTGMGYNSGILWASAAVLVASISPARPIRRATLSEKSPLGPFIGTAYGSGYLPVLFLPQFTGLFKM